MGEKATTGLKIVLDGVISYLRNCNYEDTKLLVVKFRRISSIHSKRRALAPCYFKHFWI